jgi:hypothetical protein
MGWLGAITGCCAPPLGDDLMTGGGPAAGGAPLRPIIRQSPSSQRYVAR